MKKLLLIFLILFGLLLAAIITVPLFFKGRIVNMLKAGVNKQLTATVNFNEDISLSLLRSFPNLSVRIDDIEVVNGYPFEGDTLISMKRFDATLDIMSVINGDEIRVRSILLDEPRIKAVVLSDGRANWDITKPDTAVEETPADTTATSFKVSLKKYEIKNGRIEYDDRQGNMYALLDGFNHQGKGDFSQDDFVLETVTTIEALSYRMDDIPYLNRVNTELNCDMHINTPNMRFEFNENTLRLNALEVGFDGFLAMPDENIDMDLKLVTKKVSFKEILSLVPAIYKKDFDKMETAGTTALSASAKGVLNTDLEIYPAFNVDLMVEKAMFHYSDLPERLSDINVKLKVNNADGKLNNTVVNLEKLHFLFGKEVFDARMLLTQPMTDPYVDLSAKGTVVLDNVMKLVPLDEGMRIGGIVRSDLVAKGHVSTFTGDDYESMQASGTVELEKFIYTDPATLPVPLTLETMKMTFNTQKVDLETLKGNLGHSDFSAQGSMENFFGYMFKEGEVLKGNLDLQSSLFDANTFLTEESKEQKEAPQPADTMELEAFLVPANIDFSVGLKMDKVLYDNLSLQAVKGNAVIRDETLFLNGVEMGIFGGQVVLNGTYESKNPEQPSTEMTLGVQNVDIRQSFGYFNTFKTVAPVAQYLSGKVSANLDLATLLNKDMTPVLSSITSDGLLKTTEAMLSGFAPMDALADKLKMDNLKRIYIAPGTEVAYVIKEAKVILKKAVELKIDKVALRVAEDGYTTFDQLLNYSMKLTVPKSMLGEGGNSAINGLLNEFSKTGVDIKPGDNLVINALMGGTIKAPKITTSMNELKAQFEEKVKEDLKKALDDKKEQGIKMADEKAQKLIDDASRKGDELIAQAKKQADQLRAEAKKQGDVIIAEADKKSQDLMKEAGNNPIKKVAAEKAGDKLKSEAAKKAAQLNDEADKKGNALIKKAEDEKAKLIRDAEAEKNKLK